MTQGERGRDGLNITGPPGPPGPPGPIINFQDVSIKSYYLFCYSVMSDILKKIMISPLQLFLNDTATKLNLTKIRGPPGPMVCKAARCFFFTSKAF